MPIELAGVELNKIHKIKTLEKADFVFHDIPGLDGAAAQDLGRGTARIKIEGICSGDKAEEDLNKIRNLYLKRDPADFIADIVGKAYAAKVLLEQFEVKQNAYEPQQFSFKLIIAEYAETEKTESAAGTATGASAVSPSAEVPSNIAKLEAKSSLDMINLPDSLIGGSMPEISNPFEPLSGALTPVQEAAEGFSEALNGLKKLFL